MDNDYKLYWGILHCHIRGDLCHFGKEFNDEQLLQMTDQLEQLYKYVRNDREFDFCIYADHHNMGRMIEQGYREGSPWKIIVDQAEKQSVDGEFIALNGYEYQDGMEYNVYLRHCEKLPLADTWSELIKQVDNNDKDVILAAHNRPCPTDWQFDIHPNFKLIEINNDGGVFEQWTNQGLAYGHQAAFYSGSDDHGCRPGTSAATGVWSKELTADAIWDAIWNGRTIATRNCRPQLQFSLNKHFMGSHLHTDQREDRIFHIEHICDKKAVFAAIIKNGEMCYLHESPSSEFTFKWQDQKQSEESFDYYYFKVIYEDGSLVFSSPVYVTNNDNSKTQTTVKPTKRVSYPKLDAWTLEKELPMQAGYHKYTNASGLIGTVGLASKKVRDMITHVGPDALLVSSKKSIIYPAMSGIYEYDGQQNNCLEEFKDGNSVDLLTSIVEVDNHYLVCGYRLKEPMMYSLNSDLVLDALEINPIKPYYYNLRYVTPQYLANDGVFLYWLMERECLVTHKDGAPLGYCQKNFPAFPIALAATSLSRIFVLSCDKKLICYDLSASEIATVRWEVELPDHACSLACNKNEVWVFNNKIDLLSLRENIPIFCYDMNGNLKGSMQPDLVNIRGTSIAFIDEQHFVAIHNPILNAAAAFRDELNKQGVLRIYKYDA